MSYDLQFLKATPSISVDEFNKLSEQKAEPGQKPDFLRSDRIQIAEAIKRKISGLTYKEHSSKVVGDFIEMDTNNAKATYQVSIFNSSVAISIPYWDSNANGEVFKQIDQISRILIEEFRLKGYDPQTGQFVAVSQTGSPERFAQTLKQIPNFKSDAALHFNYLPISLAIAVSLLAVLGYWKLKSKKPRHAK